MNERFIRICQALEMLQRRGASEAVFGSLNHAFVVNPCLSEREVAAFENAHRIELPIEYRGFLLHVGNGGAGPGYGLFKLGETDVGWAQEPWSENDGFIGILSEPFPHASAWNDISRMPVLDEAAQSDRVLEEQYETWEMAYFSSEKVNGAIPICHLGCALRQWLVVTGAERGNVWDDDRAEYQGLQPLAGAGRGRFTFLDWYCQWPDEALQASDCSLGSGAS